MAVVAPKHPRRTAASTTKHPGRTGGTRPVLYVLKMRISQTRTLAQGKLVIRARGYAGATAVTAKLTSRPRDAPMVAVVLNGGKWRIPGSNR